MNKIGPLLCCVFLLTAAGTHGSTHSASVVDTKGTETNPLVVKELPAEKPIIVKVLPLERSPEQIAQDKKDREERRAIDQEATQTSHTLVWIGIMQTLVFALQFVAFAYQSKSLNQTVTAAGEQSKDMKRYVDEASRSATAMEGMSAAMQANVREVTDAFAMQKVVFRNQLRAYVSVSFRTCLSQDQNRGLKYELQSDITNNGNTPAVGANTASALRVLPVPLPNDLDLTVPMIDLESAANLAPHKGFFIRTYLPTFLSDDEIREIKNGTNKALYVYGTTKYKDIFGEPHYTNFCWGIAWNVDGNPVAINVGRHNDAN
jgi:hypothetical protein